MTAGEPSTIPILPWANSDQTVLRSVPPGLGWVSPEAASCFMKFSVATFCGLLMSYLPAGAQVAAAVAEEPQQQLGLGLLAAERHAVPDVSPWP